MRGFRDDLIERLTESNPVTPSSVEGEARSLAGRRLLRQITSQPHRRGPRKTAWTAAAAAIVVLALALTQILPEGGRRASAATKILLSTADVAKARVGTAGSGGYRYLATEVETWQALEIGSSQSVVMVRSLRELWIAPDGSGRQRVSRVEPMFLSPADQRAWEAAGSPSPVAASDDTYASGQLAYQDVSDLPTDPDELSELLRTAAGFADRPANVQMLIEIADLLRLPDASPELRAALYRVAAGIEGVQLLGDVTDATGRTGTAVGIEFEESGDMQRTAILFDPETSRVLEIRTEILEPVTWTDATPPLLVDYTLYLDSGIVDSTSERP